MTAPLDAATVEAMRAAALAHPCTDGRSTHPDCRHTFGRWGLTLTCDTDGMTVDLYCIPCWHLSLSLSRRWIGTTKPTSAWSDADDREAEPIRDAVLGGIGRAKWWDQYVDVTPRAMHWRRRMTDAEIATLGKRP